MAPNTAELRKFLTNHFSSDEFSALCYDYFREVYNTFASDMGGGQRVQALIEHVQRRELEPRLLQILQRERPDQYAKYLAPRVDSPGTQPAPDKAAPTATTISGGINLNGETVTVGNDVVGRDKITQTTINIEHATIIQSDGAITDVQPTDDNLPG